MTSNSIIAVILSIYKNDSPSYIKQAIDSILNQSYSKIHLYIGIDGPVSNEIITTVKGYEINNFITVYWFSENRGLAIVLNDLLTVCFQEGYEFIARMDADDISLKERFNKQLHYLQSHPEIDIVGGAIEEIDENSKSMGKIITYPQSPKECRDFFSSRNPHAHPSVMFRKSFFEKAGCKYRPEYRQNQDTMLWFDSLIKGTQHANIPDVVLQFRVTNDLFKKRRNGLAFAKKQLNDRKIINKELNYGYKAALFAYLMFCLLISPLWLKKMVYHIFR